MPEDATDDDEGPEISKRESIIWLSVLTAWIAILSEYLVDAIEVMYCLPMIPFPIFFMCT